MPHTPLAAAPAANVEALATAGGPLYACDSAVDFAPRTTLRYGMGPERIRRPYERADGDQASHITRSIHDPPQ